MKGTALLKSTMAELKIGERDFFESRLSEHVKARRKAIKALQEAGLNSHEIARVMRRNESTIRYWLSDEMRERRQAVWRRQYKISEERRNELIEIYRLTGMNGVAVKAEEYGVTAKYVASVASQMGIKRDRRLGVCEHDLHDHRWKWAIERGAVVA